MGWWVSIFPAVKVRILSLSLSLSLRVHILDDKSTAQTKVQIQIVEQLEQQLQKVSKTI